MFQGGYAERILQCHLQLVKAISAGGYVPDRVISLILQYLSGSISRRSMYLLLQPQLGIILSDIVFPLMCFNENDQNLWDEDPHEFIKKCYDVTELYNPRTAAVDFVQKLSKHERGNLQMFIQIIVETLWRYNEATVELKPYWQKDGALLAIGLLSDILKIEDPYKSQLESMLLQNVFPEFTSHVGHLRAKAAWVAGKYAGINFSDQNNFRRALHCIVSGLTDPALPVRIDCISALRSFVQTCKDINEIRPVLPQLLDEFVKLMDEVGSEDIAITLETILDKFGGEMAPFAIGLCQSLAAIFWRCIDVSEADEADDLDVLATVGCLRAISAVLRSVSRLPYLFVRIENILLPIMRRMLTKDGEDVFDEVLDIVSHMTSFSPTISLSLWSLWPLMTKAVGDWAIDFFAGIIDPLCNYISRCTLHFLKCRNPNYQQDLWNLLSSMMSNENMEGHYIRPAPKLIQAVFRNCKGQVDQWIEPYLRITVHRLRQREKPYFKCLLIQVIVDALYYNVSLTLGVLQKLGVTSEFFNLWFHLLYQVKKSGLQANFRSKHSKKICCLGLTVLLPLPAEDLPGEAFECIFKATLELLDSYKDQVAEDDDSDNIDGFKADENDYVEVLRDSAIGCNAEDGDKVNSHGLQTFVAQTSAFQSKEGDDSDDDNIDDIDIQSPVDDVDPFIFFVETIEGVQRSNPARFHNLKLMMEQNYRDIAVRISKHAKLRKLLIETGKLLLHDSE